MSVAETYSQTLGVIDLLIKAVEIDIVVACTLHLSEFQADLFCSHIIDINKLGAVFAVAALERIRKSISRIN